MMAKQAGLIKLKGTVEGVCFYKLYEKHYARLKSSLSGKRVKTSPAFRNTMRYAGLLAKASVIGSEVYRLLPKEKKGRKVYQQLTGRAMKMLKDGIKPENIVMILS